MKKTTMTTKKLATFKRLGGALMLNLLLLSGCFWEGQSGLDPAAFADLGLDQYRRSLEGYCQNADDQEVLADPEFDLEAELTTCTYDCLLDEAVSPCVTACLAHVSGFTDACASCYGDQTQCTLDNCINDCLDGESPTCATCRDQYCTAAFEACSGG